MTLPDERYRAILYAAEFLTDMLNPKKTPKIPREYRRRAGAVLRHFPAEYQLRKLADKAPDILEAPVRTDG